MIGQNARAILKWTKTSVWSFPLLILLPLLLLAVLRISGSSVGIYNNFINDSGTKDSSLIYGKPRAIRSDEWLFGTQLAVSQKKNNLPRVNPNLGTGRDVSLQTEAPSKDWSALFKPQNWAYFVLPLEYAFAFKWWLLLYLTMVSCYFFTLRLMPGKRLFASLFSTAFSLSPFFLWWYQSAAFLSVAYGFMTLILAMRIINGEGLPFIKNKKLGTGLQLAALSFVGGCFGLILYPPFQISIVLVVLFFGVGYLLKTRFADGLSWRLLGKRIGLIFGSLVVAGVIGATFIKTHEVPIRAVNSTIYPGQRDVVGGSLGANHFFDGFLMPLLQSDKRGSSFLNNQSEDSNFILLMPFLLLPAAALIAYEWLKARRVDWVLVGLLAGGLVFLLRAFTSAGNGIFKLILLNKVQNYRLLIGMGFLGAILTVYLAAKMEKLKLPAKKMFFLAAVYGAGCFGVLMLVGNGITKHYPHFIHNLGLLAVLAAAFAGLVALLIAGWQRLFALAFLGFTILSSFMIIPLYQGLGFVNNSTLIQKIESISKPTDKWATVRDSIYSDAIVYDGIAIAAGRQSLTGAQIYPDLNFWQQVGGPTYQDVYNRGAHAIFIDDPKMDAPLKLFQQNYFLIKFDCSAFVKNNVDFALATHPLDYPCIKLATTVPYSKTIFYIYKVNE